MLALSSQNKLHLTMYLPKTRKFTTLCNRGYIVEEPLWKILTISDNEHVFLPGCYWCQLRSKNNIDHKKYLDYLLHGLEWNRAYKLVYGDEE